MCIFFAVFFFKQKTAYEMRISDWSSDVCSSDLAEETGQAMGDQHGADMDAVVEGDEQGRRRDIAVVRLQQQAAGKDDEAGGDEPEQIGRASCRARVCQYV